MHRERGTVWYSSRVVFFITPPGVQGSLGPFSRTNVNIIITAGIAPDWIKQRLDSWPAQIPWRHGSRKNKTEIVILHISAFCSEVCLDLCSNKKSTKNKLILVGSFNPSEKSWSSSVGMMIIPNTWKIIRFMFPTTNQYTNTIEDSNPHHPSTQI